MGRVGSKMWGKLPVRVRFGRINRWVRRLKLDGSQKSVRSDINGHMNGKLLRACHIQSSLISQFPPILPLSAPFEIQNVFLPVCGCKTLHSQDGSKLGLERHRAGHPPNLLQMKTNSTKKILRRFFAFISNSVPSTFNKAGRGDALNSSTSTRERSEAKSIFSLRQIKASLHRKSSCHFVQNFLLRLSTGQTCLYIIFYETKSIDILAVRHWNAKNENLKKQEQERIKCQACTPSSCSNPTMHWQS